MASLKITPWVFLKFWLQISFCRDMWGSWYFLLLYLLIIVSNASEPSTINKWPLQIGVLVTIALVFGMMGTVMGLMKHRQLEKRWPLQKQPPARAKATSQFDSLEVEAVGNADNADIDLIKSYWLRKKDG
jgi:hypothetical protein